jgi:hypothetical protein
MFYYSIGNSVIFFYWFLFFKSFGFYYFILLVSDVFNVHTFGFKHSHSCIGFLPIFFSHFFSKFHKNLIGRLFVLNSWKKYDNSSWFFFQFYPDEDHFLSGVKVHLYESVTDFLRKCFAKSDPIIEE